QPKFKDDIADQIVVIDLVGDEESGEKTESYQDKIAKLEEKVAQMEQEIDGVKEVIADLKNLSDEKGYSPFRTVAPPTYEYNAQTLSQTLKDYHSPPTFSYLGHACSLRKAQSHYSKETGVDF
ncbi:hypothetical protein A4A49_53518, partial [Nicotiana attenuata]